MLETPVFSTAAIAAPHVRAAEIGQMILASGGNAIEAVIAMAATCAVVLPHLNGLGGDAFLLAREPRGRVHAIDASGPAGTLATIERYRKREYERIPGYGPDATLTVAGVVAGWSLGRELSKALGGQLPLDLLLADAITLARNGYAVSASEVRQPFHTDLLVAPHFSSTFLTDGKAATVGSIRRQPLLADTLERLSHAGLADFYRGDVGREIALDLERIDSPIRRRDLETFRARVVHPLSVRLRHAQVYNLPPPTDGLASLLALGIADRLGMRSGESAEFHHGMIEATKRALALCDRHVTDPREMDVDTDDFLQSRFLESESLQIDRRRAADCSPAPRTTGTGAWIGCIDKDGLAVSYAQSLHGHFGSGCVLSNTGIHWHNRGMAFSLDADTINALAPGRQPPHTLNPALAVFADNRVLAYGGTAAAVQAQTFSRYADMKMSLADAVDAPRWMLASGERGLLRMEEGFDPSLMRGLSLLGHPVDETGRADDTFGRAGMIVRHARNGRVEATHDPRGDGGVMGL